MTLIVLLLQLEEKLGIEVRLVRLVMLVRTKEMYMILVDGNMMMDNCL